MSLKYCYCASPFFNKKERRIRDLMYQDFLSQNEVCILRPDLTEESDMFDASPSQESALNLLERNLADIIKADMIIFPRYTNDLGTLFEVGYAIKNNKLIYRYDYLTGKFDEIKTCIDPKLENEIVDLGKVSSAIALGYCYGDKNVGYYLPNDVNDNIMLIKFNRFDNINNFGFNLNHVLTQVKVEIKYGTTASGEKCERVVTNAYKGSVPNLAMFTDNCDNDDYLVCFENQPDPILMRLASFNFDSILGNGESIKKLYTGVS